MAERVCDSEEVSQRLPGCPANRWLTQHGRVNGVLHERPHPVLNQLQLRFLCTINCWNSVTGISARNNCSTSGGSSLATQSQVTD